jgi:class 3 adenylate cyclase
MRKPLFKIVSITSIVIFMLCGIEVNAQKPCIDCTTDSIQSMIRNARTAEDTLYSIINYLDYADMFDDPKQIVVLTDQVIRLNKKLNLINIKPYELFRDSRMLLARNETAKSIEMVKQAISECDKEKKILSLDSWLGGLRILYNTAGMQKEKLAYYEEKLAYYEENGPVENKGVCYHSIAGYYALKADYNNAISYYLKAAEVFKPYSPLAYANDIAVVGTNYYIWGNYQKAKYYLQKGYELNIKCGLWSTAMYAKKNLALIDKKKKDYKGALKNIDEALATYNLGGSDYLFIKAISLGEKAGILLEMNRYDEALPVLKEAEALRDSLTMPIVTNMGDFEGEYYMYKYFRAKGNDTDAERQLLTATAKATEIKSERLILKYEKELAVYYSETGRLTQAIPYALSYIKSSDSLREIQNGYNVAQYETEQKDLAAYKELQKQKLVRNGFVGGFAVVLLFAGVFFSQRNKIKKGKKRSDDLLLNILPAEVAEELKEKGSADAQLIDEVTVLFTDFKGFTSMSEKLSPKELVRDIHECFSAFDLIMERNRMEKIKTIGDSYMAAGGLPTPNNTHATDAVKAALEIRQFIDDGIARKIAMGAPYFEIRIGIHTGPVVAGIVGVKKFAYDIWGDTVNTASRMESSGEAGKVNISGCTYELVKDKFNCTYRGKIEAKHKGMIDMYFVENAEN